MGKWGALPKGSTGRCLWGPATTGCKIIRMKRVSWPAALVIVSLLVCVTVLGAMGKPVTSIVGLGTTVLLALGVSELKGLRENTNGTQTKLIDAMTHSMMYSNMRQATDRERESSPYVPADGNPPEVPR